MNRLTAMMLFRRVAELGSFAAAARETGFSNAAVSKNIAGLEAHLGVRLLERSTRRLRLTAAGDAYLQRCVQILDAIEEAELEAAEDALAPRGLLRVSVPMSMGLLHIAPLLGRFLESCPEVELDIVMSDRKVNLIEEGFDVALRAGGPLPDSSLMARQLAPIARQVCAAPAYLDRRGTPAIPDDLTDHDCLVYSLSETPRQWQLEGPEGRRTVAVSGRLCVNSSLALRDAAIDGAGLALLPDFIAAPDIRAGRLTPVLPAWTPAEQALYAMHAGRRHVAPKIRAFIDFLVEAFRDGAPWDARSDTSNQDR